MALNSLTYTRLEVLRTFRNVRMFIFTLAIPVSLYLVIAGSNRHESVQGISFPALYMVGMAGYGATLAALGGGARIAGERQTGWNRQLRLTPLRPRVYFRTKVFTSYLLAAMSIVLLYACGLLYGVRLDIGRWFEMTGLILIALIPFAAMGILIGHLITVDSIGPAMGGLGALFGFLGGQWFPITPGTVFAKIAEFVPSYWMTQAAHVGIGGSQWPAKAWIVIAGWTAVATWLAVQAYRRDTKRA